MHDHPEIDDTELLERFAANTLPAFPHEEHLHVVFAKSATASEDETLAFMREGIIAMAVANGKPEAYHDTRTGAWTRLIVAKRTGFTGTFAEFLEQHPELIPSTPSTCDPVGYGTSAWDRRVSPARCGSARSTPR